MHAASPREWPETADAANGHASSATRNNDGSTRQKARNTDPDDRALDRKFRSWRFDCQDDDSTLGRAGLEKFFQQAYKLVGADINISQCTVQLLAEEGGLKKIKELLEDIPFDTYQENLQRKFFDEAIAPLLKLITSPDVAKSSLLEREINKIYNLIWGNETGSRSLRLFRFVADVASTAEDLLAPLAAFAALVDLKGKAAVTESFDKIAERFAAVVQDFKDDKGDLTSLRVKGLLEHINKRLECGQALPDVNGAAQGVRPQATFLLKHDAPGRPTLQRICSWKLIHKQVPYPLAVQDTTTILRTYGLSKSCRHWKKSPVHGQYTCRFLMQLVFT